MSRHHNGNQNRVLKAVREGNATVPDVMAATGLSKYQVTNAMRRLHDSRLIDRVIRGRYRVAHQHQALTEAWA